MSSQEQRQQQEIAHLLAYPRVGPLSIKAIARNLGRPARQVEATIRAMTQQGRLIEVGDGRYTSPS